jgi:hypothetical protein
MKIFAITSLAGMLVIAGQVSAHMEMTYPPPLKSKVNPFAGDDKDFTMTAPLGGSGGSYPCKGYLSLMGTTKASPVATWQAGSGYNMTISGGAAHNGGSCQASISTDGGKSFKVIHSYIGGCPSSGTTSYPFTLPADIPASDNAIFAWSWNNNVGNREFYMNCAIVKIAGSGVAKKEKRAVAFNARPEIFRANFESSCTTVEGMDVQYPNPGPDVTVSGTKLAAPVGNCGAAAAPGAGSGSGPVSSSVAPVAPAPSTVAPKPSAPTAAPSPSSLSVAPSAPAEKISIIPISPSSSRPGGVFVTVPTSGASSATPVPSSPAVKPTTLLTVTAPASGSAPPSTPTTTASPLPAPGTGSGSDGAVAVGTKCAPEGMWNCIGGAGFQRCASGQWSAIIAMAAGTKCQPGQSDTLISMKKRGGARRFMSAWDEEK